MSTTSIAAAPAGARLIQLTKGQFAIVDDDDFERLNVFKWFAQWCLSTKSFYAARNSPYDTNGKRSAIRMHRVITCAPKGAMVDHMNHDTLDNRRENLRVCTNGQNMANKRVYSNNTSGFKGISWRNDSKKWQAHLSLCGKRKRLGHFATALEAALAYDRAAIEHFGRFALTNKMLGLLP